MELSTIIDTPNKVTELHFAAKSNKDKTDKSIWINNRQIYSPQFMMRKKTSRFQVFIYFIKTNE